MGKRYGRKNYCGWGAKYRNVCSVIQDIKPFGVDVSSGVEKDGVKDFKMMKDFINAVKNC